MKTYSFLFWGYNVFWIGMAAYIVWLQLRLKKTEQELNRLEKRVDKNQRSAAS